MADVDFNIKEEMKKPHLITGGTFACAGCNPVLGIRLMLIALGKNVIMVNSSGCMTLTATWPFTPYRVPWVHGAIENGGSVAAGILMGLKALKKDKDTHVVVYAGDGATYDIGLQSLSGMIHRNEKIIYICYNNCQFANTGHQCTSATEKYARTTTTPPPIGNPLPRKNMAKMMAMGGAEYCATACVSYPFDFIKKLRKAAKVEGSVFIDLLSPCEPGWLVKPNETIKSGKLMVESGMWPLYEIDKKKITINHKPQMIPVKEALKIQGRFKHLTEEQIGEIQETVIKEWEMITKGRFWEAEEY
ncbi:pyruvate synthase subunit beta [Candidatus Woesearchaeota archaeon]|nr:pyruvate synthase subunit beta [Candidatus Woesearchaeota archaeon]